jgi:hypothetical protein
MAPAFGYRFGLREVFLQSGNIRFQGRDYFGCCFGLLAPLFTSDFNLLNRLL